MTSLVGSECPNYIWKDTEGRYSAAAAAIRQMTLTRSKEVRYSSELLSLG